MIQWTYGTLISQLRVSETLQINPKLANTSENQIKFLNASELSMWQGFIELFRYSQFHMLQYPDWSIDAVTKEYTNDCN